MYGHFSRLLRNNIWEGTNSRRAANTLHNQRAGARWQGDGEVKCTRNWMYNAGEHHNLQNRSIYLEYMYLVELQRHDSNSVVYVVLVLQVLQVLLDNSNPCS